MKLKDAVILIADDEPGLLRIFRAWFEREGCRVLTAENGMEALELASNHHVDVLVSDIRMPILDGIELARRLNATSKYLPKIIFISGFTDLSERHACDLGAEAVLAKPVRRAELISAVDRSLMEFDERWRQALRLSRPGAFRVGRKRHGVLPARRIPASRWPPGPSNEFYPGWMSMVRTPPDCSKSSNGKSVVSAGFAV